MPLPHNSAAEPIVLLSSSPLPPLRTLVSSPSSSPLLSPSALLRELVEKSSVAAKGATGRAASRYEDNPGEIWDVPDENDGVEILHLEPPPKRKRVAKSTGSSVAKNPRAKRITEKSGRSTVEDGKRKGKTLGSTTATRSEYFGTKNQEHFIESLTFKTFSKKVALSPKSPNKQTSQSPPAQALRKQWTPAENPLAGIGDSPAVGGKGGKEKGEPGFAFLVGEMKYSAGQNLDGGGGPSAPAVDGAGNGLIKKRPIEMVTLQNAIAISSDKPKAQKLKQPRKKAKTITGQATAQYRKAGETAGPSLMEYFTPDKPVRKRKKPESHKELKKEPVVLLSPKSAKQRFDEQECIFGTSSQLEAQDIEIIDSQDLPKHSDDKSAFLPPASTSVVRRSFLDSLAKDRKGGNKLFGSRRGMNIDILDIEMEEFGNHVQGELLAPTKPRESRLGKTGGPGGRLWGAAARDLEGGLLSMEAVNMVGADEAALLSDDFGPGEEGLVPSHLLVPEDLEELSHADMSRSDITGLSGTDLDGVTLQPRPGSLDAEVLPGGMAALGGPARQSGTIDPLLPPKSTTHRSKPRISTTATAHDTFSRPLSTPAIPVAPPEAIPDFGSYPSVKLKSMVAGFGFKDLKTRERMVSCLERCWQAQNKSAFGEAASSRGMATLPPKRSGAATSMTGASDPPRPVPTRGRGGKRDAQQPSSPAAPGRNLTSHISLPESKNASQPTSPERGRFPTPKQLIHVPWHSPGQARPKTVVRIPLGTSSTERVAEAIVLPTSNTRGSSLSPLPRFPTSLHRSRSRRRYISPKKWFPSQKLQQPKPSTKGEKKKPSSKSRAQTRPKSPGLRPASLSPSRTYRQHAAISTAVRTSAPNTEGFLFHRAMLMYDPIVLEDLTRWLSSKGLQGVGTDEIVNTNDVKEWCRKNSVCYVETTIKGHGRKRF